MQACAVSFHLEETTFQYLLQALVGYHTQRVAWTAFDRVVPVADSLIGTGSCYFT